MKGVVTRKMVDAGVDAMPHIPSALYGPNGSERFEQMRREAVIAIYRAMEDASEAPKPL